MRRSQILLLPLAAALALAMTAPAAANPGPPAEPTTALGGQEEGGEPSSSDEEKPVPDPAGDVKRAARAGESDVEIELRGLKATAAAISGNVEEVELKVDVSGASKPLAWTLRARRTHLVAPLRLYLTSADKGQTELVEGTNTIRLGTTKKIRWPGRHRLTLSAIDPDTGGEILATAALKVRGEADLDIGGVNGSLAAGAARRIWGTAGPEMVGLKVAVYGKPAGAGGYTRLGAATVARNGYWSLSSRRLAPGRVYAQPSDKLVVGAATPKVRLTSASFRKSVPSLGGYTRIKHQKLAPPAPEPTISWYISRYDLPWVYDQGCQVGEADAASDGAQVHVTLLDFAALTRSRSGTPMVTAFAGTDFTLAQAGKMVFEYARGYQECVEGDPDSVMYIALATNNKGDWVTAAAGKAFAREAKRVARLAAETWERQQAYPVAAQDFESWASASASLRWFRGYASVSGAPMLINYGSADGCPWTRVPKPNECASGLPADLIYTLSATGPGYALPEIYRRDGVQARQWKYLSLYGLEEYGEPIRFIGALAQQEACRQNGGCADRGLETATDSSPKDAWAQLSAQLYLPPEAPGAIPAATQMRWQEP